MQHRVVVICKGNAYKWFLNISFRLVDCGQTGYYECWMCRDSGKMDLWFCGLLPWQTGRGCSLLRRWLSVGCGFWGNLDNLGAWQQCNESYPFIAYKGTYQVRSLFFLFFSPLSFVFFPFSDLLPEVCFCVFPIQWFTSRVVCFCVFPIQWFTSRVVCFCVFPIQWFTSRVVCLDQNYSCKVHTNWTLTKLKLYKMTPFSLWVMLILCLPWRHTSRLTFFLFRIPNVSNCLQPASSKTACVLELGLHCLWRKKANKGKPFWNQIWFCHASAAGVWSLVARPALTSSSPQHHPISPSGTSSHCQVCGRVRSVSQCIVLFVCVCTYGNGQIDLMEMKSGSRDILCWGQWFSGKGWFDRAVRKQMLSLSWWWSFIRKCWFLMHMSSANRVSLSVFIACFQCWGFDSFCQFALFKPTASKK